MAGIHVSRLSRFVKIFAGDKSAMDVVPVCEAFEVAQIEQNNIVNMYENEARN